MPLLIMLIGNDLFNRAFFNSPNLLSRKFSSLTIVPLHKNMDLNILSKLGKVIKKHKKCLTKEEQDYLLNFEFKTSNFYGLPKIHKSELIKREIQLQNSEYIQCLRPPDLKFRPIVAGPACPTHRLSNLIDIILQPFLQNIKSYVRDDLD